jgi:hypothetical protein
VHHSNQFLPLRVDTALFSHCSGGKLRTFGMPAEITVSKTQRMLATERDFYQTVKQMGIADLLRATDGQIGQIPVRIWMGGFDVTECHIATIIAMSFL